MRLGFNDLAGLVRRRLEVQVVERNGWTSIAIENSRVLCSMIVTVSPGGIFSAERVLSPRAMGRAVGEPGLIMPVDGDHEAPLSMSEALGRLGLHPLWDCASEHAVMSVIGEIDAEDAVMEELVDGLSSVALRLLQPARAAIERRFDVRALNALKSVRDFDVDAYTFYAGDGEAAERRRAAAERFPCLAGLFADPAVGVALDLGTEDDFLSALGSLVSRLHPWCTGVDGDALERFAWTTEIWEDTPPALLLAAVSGLPPEWRPARPTGEDELTAWQAFEICVDILAPLLPHSSGFGRLVRRHRGDWERLLGDLDAACGGGVDGGSDPTLPAAMQGMASSYLREVAFPVLAGANPVLADALAYATATPVASDIAMRILMGDACATDAVNRLRDWRRNRIACCGQTPPDAEDAGFPVPLSFVDAPNELRIACLSSRGELVEEAARFGIADCEHWADGVRDGSLHVAVVSQPPDHLGALGLPCGTPRLALSVFEFTIDDQNGILVGEHWGQEGDAPPVESLETVEWFVEAVDSGEVELFAALPAETAPDGRDGDALSCLAGYDWRDPQAVDRSLSGWRPFLRRELRREGPGESGERVEMRMLALLAGDLAAGLPERGVEDYARLAGPQEPLPDPSVMERVRAFVRSQSDERLLVLFVLAMPILLPFVFPLALIQGGRLLWRGHVAARTRRRSIRVADCSSIDGSVPAAPVFEPRRSRPASTFAGPTLH